MQPKNMSDPDLHLTNWLVVLLILLGGRSVIAGDASFTGSGRAGLRNNLCLSSGSSRGRRLLLLYPDL
jgi:hypothetical protein